MSDVPAAPPPAPSKSLLDSIVVKYLFLLVGLAAPLPLLMALIQLWSQIAPDAIGDPFSVIHNLANANSGESGCAALAMSVFAPLVMLMVVFRSLWARILAALALFAATGAEIYLFAQLTAGWGGG